MDGLLTSLSVVFKIFVHLDYHLVRWTILTDDLAL